MPCFRDFSLQIKNSPLRSSGSNAKVVQKCENVPKFLRVCLANLDGGGAAQGEDNSLYFTSEFCSKEKSLCLLFVFLAPAEAQGVTICVRLSVTKCYYLKITFLTKVYLFYFVRKVLLRYLNFHLSLS